MFKSFVVSFLMVFALSAVAHEGHDAGGEKAPHGGVMKEGKLLDLEVVTKGSDVKLYFISHEGDEIKLTDVKMVLSSRLPKAKYQPQPFEIGDKAFVTKVDFKKLHRVELKVEITIANKKDQFIVQVEK